MVTPSGINKKIHDGLKEIDRSEGNFQRIRSKTKRESKNKKQNGNIAGGGNNIEIKFIEGKDPFSPEI